MDWKVHRLKSLYDDFISAVAADYFFTNKIQRRWKMCVDRKGDYVEKLASFGHIPWEYLGQPINFLVVCKWNTDSNITLIKTFRKVY